MGSRNLILTIEQMNWTYGRKRITMWGDSGGGQKGTLMHHEYDLFERFPDGSSLWRACVVGLESTRQYMFDLARRSPNQFYAMNLASGKIVSLGLQQGKFNLPPKMGRGDRAATA